MRNRGRGVGKEKREGGGRGMGRGRGGKGRTREGVAVDKFVWETEEAAESSDFVFVEVFEGFNLERWVRRGKRKKKKRKKIKPSVLHGSSHQKLQFDCGEF